MKRSLYRKYRPQTFAELVGQDHVSRTLRNAVRSGTGGPRLPLRRAARHRQDQHRRASSPRRSTAPAPTPSTPVTEPTVTPCGVCEHCRAIAASTALDVIEMDAASNRGIDDIRELRDKVAFAPVQGRYKVYIIDEVHMLTTRPSTPCSRRSRSRRRTSSSCWPRPRRTRSPPPSSRAASASTSAGRRCTTSRTGWHRARDRAPSEARRPASTSRPPCSRSARHAAGRLPRRHRHAGQARHLLRRGHRSPRATCSTSLGVTSTDLLFEITDIVIERDTAGALQFVQRLAERGHRLLAVHPRPAAPPAPGLPACSTWTTSPTTTPRCARCRERSSSTSSCSTGWPQQASQLAAASCVRFIEPLGRGPDARSATGSTRACSSSWRSSR